MNLNITRSFLSLLLVSFLFACKRDVPILVNVDQYAGEDLYNQLSTDEKNLIGTWYFSHEVFKLTNGTDSVSTESLIDYSMTGGTDSLRFFSTKFVGNQQYCPYNAPDSLKDILKVSHSFTGYLEICSPDHICGWLVRNGDLVIYTGHGGTIPLVNDYHPIVQLNNDSLVFEYDDHYVNATSYTMRTPVFYKK